MALKVKTRVKASIPTSSMADIAFLLIVFFLVTTSFSKDKGLGLTLPKPGDETRVPSRNITKVWINAAGDIMHDMTQVTVTALEERIRNMTSQNPNLVVSIKTAPDAQYESFVDVVDSIKKAGNEKISIAEPGGKAPL